MTKSKEIIFPTNPEIGIIYKVPCVKNIRGEIWPINSHLHDDKKIINFEWKHWHIDWRFVSNIIWQYEIEKYGTKSVNEAKYVITLNLPSTSLDNRFTTNCDTFFYRRLKCKRLYSVSGFWQDFPTGGKIAWPINLHKKFSCSKLKQIDDQLICPHKGIAIDKNCKDTKGNYVCPGHLLRFNPETLNCLQL